METRIVQFDGVPLIVPMMELNDGSKVPLDFPYDTFKEFTSFCGAGRGIGDLVVPESIFWLKVSPVCYIHDIMWQMAQPTWTEFHQSNSTMMHNLLTVIEKRSSNKWLEHLRNYRAITFYNAVDVLGEPIFWAVKENQINSLGRDKNDDVLS